MNGVAPITDNLLMQLRSFFVECCEPPQCMTELLSGEALPTRNLWTLDVDCMKLLAACPSVADLLFYHTTTVMDALRKICAEVCAKAGRHLNPSDLSPRLSHLPTVGTPPPSLPPQRGVLVSVCGSIVRMNTKKVVPLVRKLKCFKCLETVELTSSPFDRSTKLKPHCANKECKGEELQQIGQVWMDYAECRLQQRHSESGRLPRTLLITLEDDLSKKCTVGQLVEVIGILFPKWRNTYPNALPIIEPTIWALNVNVMDSYRDGGSFNASAAAKRRHNGQVEESAFTPESFYSSFGKDKFGRGSALVNSVCPHLAGLFAPRMAVILATLGGTSTAGKTRMHVRSTIHCLFVGDSSTGKSQLLRCAALLAPRSTSTTGMGSTSAGLTVAASKEQGEWVLEPGALVLSDGGVCVIDELRTVSVGDRASLHEAMEQQTISVAKAGMVTKLRTCCSVISACNPPTRQNGTEIGVGGPLLSRFDFVFLLWDTPSPETDDRIATHILNYSQAGRLPDSVLSLDDVGRYLRWVHAHYSQNGGPLLTDGASRLIKAYYEMQQRRGAVPNLADCVPITIRLLESLVRVTQAYAKLHLERVCTEMDAAFTVFLFEQSAYSLKCPLEVLGPDVYTSSKCLEEYFLDLSPKGVEKQRTILQAITDTFSSCSSTLDSDTTLENVPQDLAAGEWLSKLRAPHEKTPSPDRLVGKRSNSDSGTLEAALRSVKRLVAEVRTPREEPQTVICYPADSLSQLSAPPVSLPPARTPNRLRDAKEIMRSLSFNA
ncbi:minichromosome maintenance (MCM) complex subunit,putative [Trypanosoma brucei gambiense DAL972]|uniref:Minichromosome maintenance (MCM) complex subunit,putative n=2 Tax=Trypanosoma brucei TaxID=5691 RepID=C9ZYH2_TRYB9|nr:minichromosome maintenance (MCM) complex subunit,putative [Trypanosoma brucei gambiense DAL972]RHW70485.1 DNA replication licensing factor MCM9 [Trypanosoma brucei equiperdum]CBH14471.1 minichromosome maintenance (MCM) complex subunit,putative [Trypanosoma brucei gambiense DAL972]|eukprot:XP_011776737.1 minichromosome maintenance (MCM) complex subunit,putative [Trypanosoma brucei gambiense DAL972]